MKKSRFTDSQIIGILKANETASAVSDLCREHDSAQNQRAFML
ncbi:MAG: transposase [Ostreibacterium sp.]